MARLTEFFAHPALAGLHSDQLRNAPVWRRRAVQVSPRDAVLARYDNGAVALAERRLGAGRSVLLTTGIRESWSALALEPGFAPMALALVRHLANRRSGAGVSAATVGGSVDVAAHAALLGTEPLANHLAQGRAVLIESPDGTIEKMVGSPPAFTPRQAGVYGLHIPGSARAPIPLAANVDPLELQLTAVSTAAFTARIARDALPQTQPQPRTGAEENSLPFEPWWFVLLLVTALLLAEGYYAARLTHASGRAADPNTRTG